MHLVLRIRENRWIWSDYMHKEVTGGRYSEEDLRGSSYEIIKRYVGLSCGRERKYTERYLIVESKYSQANFHKAALIRPMAE